MSCDVHPQMLLPFTTAAAAPAATDTCRDGERRVRWACRASPISTTYTHIPPRKLVGYASRGEAETTEGYLRVWCIVHQCIAYAH